MTIKKYYWLKLKEDFFDEDTLSWLEEQENGKAYCLFYLKLCLKSLRSEGVLIRTVGEMLVPYDAKKLAEITKTDVDTVVIAMELFKKIGLVKILENGEIFISQLTEMVGSETDKAQIMRKKRALEKLVGNNVTLPLPNSYTEIEQEKEKDIELEKEVELEVEKNRIQPQQLFELLKENGFNITDTSRLEIIKFIAEGRQPELVKFAIDEAIENKVDKWSYIQTILNRYRHEDMKTYEEAIRDKEQKYQKKLPKYSSKQLEAFYI